MADLINRRRFIFYRRLSIANLISSHTFRKSIPHMMADLIALADLFYVGRLLVADLYPITADFLICRKFCTSIQIYLVDFLKFGRFLFSCYGILILSTFTNNKLSE